MYTLFWRDWQGEVSLATVGSVSDTGHGYTCIFCMVPGSRHRRHRHRRHKRRIDLAKRVYSTRSLPAAAAAGADYPREPPINRIDYSMHTYLESRQPLKLARKRSLQSPAHPAAASNAAPAATFGTFDFAHSFTRKGQRRRHARSPPSQTELSTRRHSTRLNSNSGASPALSNSSGRTHTSDSRWKSSMAAGRENAREDLQHAWFLAAEEGDIAAMARMLTQQPALVDATMATREVGSPLPPSVAKQC